MPIQDCLLVNNMQEGCFRLTVQRLADTHDITTNIVFPANPQTGDIHLVDYDGDNWWVAYRYGAGTWNIQAEIEGNNPPDLSAYALDIDNVPKVIWVNSESDPAYSAVHNPNKPFTSLEDATNELPATPAVDSYLNTILGSLSSWGILPGLYTIKILGDSYVLLATEILAIDSTKAYKLHIESGISVEEGADVGDLFEDIIDISGPGYLYQNSLNINDSLLTPNSSTPTIKIDLDAIYFKGTQAASGGAVLSSSIFDLSETSAKTNIHLNQVFLNGAGVVTLPADTNLGCNIDIDNIIISTSLYNFVCRFPEVGLGSAAVGRKSTNINIGQVTSTTSGILNLFYGTDNSLYGHQNLNINIDQLNVGQTTEVSLASIFGGDYTGSVFKININQSTAHGPYFTVRGNSNWNGDIHIHVEKEFSKTDGASVPYILNILETSQVSGTIKYTGNYRGYVSLGVMSGTLDDNLFFEGNYYVPNTTHDSFIRYSDTQAVNHKIHLNNCKIIGDTSASLVSSGISPAGTLTLVCSNVHTNMMGALPGWVTIEGDLTQNVNYL